MLLLLSLFFLYASLIMPEFLQHHHRVNAVYYPSWKVYKGKPPSCINVHSVTHIFYAFVR